MTANQSRLLGALGKDPLVPGTSSTQSPMMDNPVPGHHVTPNGVDTMNVLISTVVLNNSHVKKLNAFCRLRRSNPREMASVSDNEEESPVPMLGTLLDIQASLRCSSINNLYPDMGPDPNPLDDPTITALDTVPMPDSRDWHDLITGSSPMEASPEQPPKNAQVDYQNLGSIYSSIEVSKKKQVLNMINIPNAILQMAYNKLYIPLSMLHLPCQGSGLATISSSTNTLWQWHWQVVPQ